MSDVTAVSFYRGHTSLRLKKNTARRRGQGLELQQDIFLRGRLGYRTRCRGKKSRGYCSYTSICVWWLRLHWRESCFIIPCLVGPPRTPPASSTPPLKCAAWSIKWSNTTLCLIWDAFGLLLYVYHHTLLFFTLPPRPAGHRSIKKNCAPGSVAMVLILPVTLPPCVLHSRRRESLWFMLLIHSNIIKLLVDFGRFNQHSNSSPWEDKSLSRAVTLVHYTRWLDAKAPK